MSKVTCVKGHLCPTTVVVPEYSMSNHVHHCIAVQHFEVMLVLLRSDIVADLLENHIDCASEALSSTRSTAFGRAAHGNLFQRL